MPESRILRVDQDLTVVHVGGAVFVEWRPVDVGVCRVVWFEVAEGLNVVQSGDVLVHVLSLVIFGEIRPLSVGLIVVEVRQGPWVDLFCIEPAHMESQSRDVDVHVILVQRVSLRLVTLDQVVFVLRQRRMEPTIHVNGPLVVVDKPPIEGVCSAGPHRSHRGWSGNAESGEWGSQSVVGVQMAADVLLRLQNQVRSGVIISIEMLNLFLILSERVVVGAMVARQSLLPFFCKIVVLADSSVLAECVFRFVSVRVEPFSDFLCMVVRIF